jgi:hypothetical protein
MGDEQHAERQDPNIGSVARVTSSVHAWSREREGALTKRTLPGGLRDRASESARATEVGATWSGQDVQV